MSTGMASAGNHGHGAQPRADDESAVGATRFSPPEFPGKL
jgi:hypothetical protein